MGKYRVNALPTIYLLDRQGRVVKVVVGGTAPEILDRMFAEL